MASGNFPSELLKGNVRKMGGTVVSVYLTFLALAFLSVELFVTCH